VTPPRYRRQSASQWTNGSSISSSIRDNDRRSISANYSGSPLSTSRYNLGFSPSSSQSTIARRTTSGSSFSLSPTTSPLFQKAIANQNATQHQLTHPQPLDLDAESQIYPPLRSNASPFSASGLGRSQSMRERARPKRESLDANSPSPTRRPKIVPGLNYKWLYDKGRTLPRSESSYAF
jgi:hypothetical protein